MNKLFIKCCGFSSIMSGICIIFLAIFPEFEHAWMVKISLVLFFIMFWISASAFAGVSLMKYVE